MIRPHDGGTLLIAALLALAHADAPADLDAAVKAAFATCGRLATYPPPALDDKLVEKLREGSVAQTLQRGEGDAPTAAVGMVLANATVAEAWLACQGPHASPGENPEFLVQSLPAHQAVWYGYVELPWPLRDRQYVVRSRPNIEMAEATGDRCWEHAWREYPQALARVRTMVTPRPIEGITPERIDQAVVTSWNRGSWLLSAVDDERVLVMFQASLVVDGSVPDWIVPRLTASKLEGMLTRVRDRAETWAAAHYDRDHEPFAGGHGRIIAPLGP